MDDDFDIYEDLPVYNIKDNEVSPVKNEDLSKECEELKREVTELTTKLQKLQKINENLEVNMSSLLKTAKAEIARKDKMIDDLRRQVDNMSFRRGNFNRNLRENNKKPVKPIATQEPNLQVEEPTDRSNNQSTSHVKTKPIVNQSDQDQDLSDYEGFCNHSYDPKHRFTHPAESSKVSTTVFTERLRKRIIEEEEAEQKKKLLSEEKEKQNLLSENKHESNREINIDNKENQSQFSIWNSNVDNTSSRCKASEPDCTDNSNSMEDNAACITNQQRPALSTKVSGKRVEHDVDVPCNKRRKLDVEQNVCVNKSTLPKKEDIFNGYDNGIISNTRIDKLDYEENSNSYVERNDPRINAQHERDNSRSKLNDTSYKRKEHYKKSSNDYNYSKESAYYHEKDKYNRTRNRSPVLRYSDRKHKYYDDRYRNHRDRFDRRRNFHDKEEECSIASNRKFYDLRNKDKCRATGKYNTEYNSLRSKGNRYLDPRASRSVSHERSKSGSRERTSHKIYDKRSKSTRTSNDSEEHASVPLKKKDEVNELKNIPEKRVETNSTESLEDGEILDTSLNDTVIQKENKEIENDVRKGVNVNNYKTTVDRSEKERNEDNDQADVKNDFNKHLATSENQSKCDEHRQLQKADKEVINNCDHMQNVPEDAKYNVETEKPDCNDVDTFKNNARSTVIHEKENNTSKHKQSSSKNNYENQTAVASTTKSSEKTEEEDNRNEHGKPKAPESRKESSECPNSKVIVLARRRKRVQLVDNNASMTILVNGQNTNSDTNLKSNIENNSKLRSCKVSRSYKDVL